MQFESAYPDMAFIRKREDFTCNRCLASVKGNGYTNHCPSCLWSRHVDILPGDRAETCGGMMKPEEVMTRNRNYIVIHLCTTCGKQKTNKLQKGDNFNTVLKIAKTSSHLR